MTSLLYLVQIIQFMIKYEEFKDESNHNNIPVQCVKCIVLVQICSIIISGTNLFEYKTFVCGYVPVRFDSIILFI